jgi:hypothetical protein
MTVSGGRATKREGPVRCMLMDGPAGADLVYTLSTFVFQPVRL